MASDGLSCGEEDWGLRSFSRGDRRLALFRVLVVIWGLICSGEKLGLDRCVPEEKLRVFLDQSSARVEIEYAFPYHMMYTYTHGVSGCSIQERRIMVSNWTFCGQEDCLLRDRSFRGVMGGRLADRGFFVRWLDLLRGDLEMGGLCRGRMWGCV